jgi:UDP-2-acetamido-3-amino-2,3-dideoxy-glucuronate N-acetyltransferase
MLHKLADVQSTHIGANSRIWQFTVVMPRAVIGSNCNIGACCFIEDNVLIGDNVTIKNGIQLWDGVVIEDDVFLGPNATFTNVRFPRSRREAPRSRPFVRTLVRKGASVGANATIVCGITIGEGAMIGAGSVVTKDVPPNELWYGNPARYHGPANAPTGNRAETGRANAVRERD